MIRLQAIITVTLLPEDYDSDGFLYFDLESNTDVTFFKSVEQINDLNEITEEAVLGFTLPRTPKNVRIVESFDLENVKDEPLPINVIASLEGQTLRQNRLTILNVSDESEAYECELERPSDHWISGIEFPLCDIDFGDYTFTAQTVNQRNTSWPYVDGDTGIAFPIANYGVFLGRSNSPSIPGKPYFLENYRPWINPLKVLQEGFCKLGWNFECDLLQTDYGRSLLTYILKDDLSIDGQQGNAIFAAAEKDVFVRTNLDWQFLYVDEIVYDTITVGASNFIDDKFFAAPGIFDLEFNFDVDAFAGTGSVEFTLEVFKSSGGGSQSIATESINVPVTAQANQNLISITIEDVDLLSNEIVFARLSYQYNKSGVQVIPPSIIYNGNFSARRKAGIPLQGDNVVFSELIDCNYLFVDYLKGISHIFNFKFITDWANRTVRAFPTDEQDIFGTTVDGFYLNTIKEVTPLRKSRSVLNKRNTNDRYALLRFKPSTDPGIQKEIEQSDDPLFSKRFDYGSDLPGNTVELTNPFFEATRNDSTTEVSFNGVPINMPYILDNLDNKLSFKIAPRILYFIPETQQYTGQTTGPAAVSYRGVAATTNSYGWAFMVQPLSHFFFPAPFRIEENVIYGDVKNDMSRFWARDLFSRIVLKEMTYNLLSTFNDYQLYDFRLLYKIFYDGREYLGRLTQVENQQTLVDLADLTFQPEPSVPLCDLLQEPDETEICTNNPKLIITTAENCCEDELGCTDCIKVELGGSNNSTIDTQLIEASFNNGETWVEQNEFCCSDHGGEPFLIRGTTTYTDDCPTIVRNRLIDPCLVLESSIELTCVFDDNCATLEVGGVQDCESIVKIEYEINGGDKVLWDNNPVCLESGDRITWYATIGTECCGETEFTTECFAEEIGCEFDPELACSFSPDGSTLTILPVGDLPAGTALDIIQYKCEGDSCWTTIECSDVGTAINPPCECVQVKRVVVTCLRDCPVKCFESECCYVVPECAECIEQCGTIINSSTALLLSIEKDGVTTNVTGSISDRTLDCNGDNTTFIDNLRNFLITEFEDCEDLQITVDCSTKDPKVCIMFSSFVYQSFNFFIDTTTENIPITGCESCVTCDLEFYGKNRLFSIWIDSTEYVLGSSVGVECIGGSVVESGDFSGALLSALDDAGECGGSVTIQTECVVFDQATMDPNNCLSGIGIVNGDDVVKVTVQNSGVSLTDVSWIAPGCKSPVDQICS